jgi:hypothetical protein
MIGENEPPDYWGFWTVIIALIQLLLDLGDRYRPH